MRNANKLLGNINQKYSKNNNYIELGLDKATY